MAENALRTALVEIAQKAKLQSPTITIRDAPNHGHLAKVLKVTLKDAQGETLHLFVKEKPNDTATADWAFAFQNEAHFFNNIVHEFRDIASETGVGLPSIPTCYFANAERIILEDLQATGYTIWTPLCTALDTSHITSVLEAYGKFHAFSFAFRNKHQEKFDSLKGKPQWFTTNFDRLTSSGFYKSLTEKLADCFDEATEFHYIDAVASFIAHGQLRFYDRLYNAVENNVLVHGDCWTHNYMFRYDDAATVAKLQDVCLIDFQLAARTTPINDLAYFLMTSACSQHTIDALEDYLQVYHRSLEKHLLQLHCPTTIYTLQALKDDWQKFSLLGLMIAAFITKPMIADKDEVDAQNQFGLPERFNFVSRNEELYRQRMRIVIKYYYDSGMLAQPDGE